MNRTTVVYIAYAFIAGIVLLCGYFFFEKTPERATSKRVDVASKVILFRDIKYSGEKKGLVDWEIRAKLMRKYIDTNRVDMEGIEGTYKPRPDTTVTFTAASGEMDTEKEIGNVQRVEVFYKGEYVIKSPSMQFDFKKSLARTDAPVELRGKKFTMAGIGLNADTKEQVITVEKDVSGTIDQGKDVSGATDAGKKDAGGPVDAGKGKYRFKADKFIYLLKDNTYIFEGNVAVKGERMDMFCDRVRVLSNQDAMEKIDATGHVQILSKGTIAKSERAVYYLKEDKVVLTEQPKIVRENVHMEGETIVYDLATDKFSAEKPKMKIEQRP
ncbi:MAG: LPS export ABC transporter periplasmic protein LptC [Syntrophorhabdales bacterium]|jgi:LPS export ABC transporter protein LptC/lipopolysaccharide transport protein LptA